MCLNQIYWLREINQLQFSLDSDCHHDEECYHHHCDNGHISYCNHDGRCECKSRYKSTSTIMKLTLENDKVTNKPIH